MNGARTWRQEQDAERRRRWTFRWLLILSTVDAAIIIYIAMRWPW